MAIRDFEHAAATSIEQAKRLASHYREQAAFVAGGTDLLGTLKDGVHRSCPKLLVDLKPIAELRGLREDRDGLRVGALTTLASLARDPAVRARYPLLGQAARAVASPQIRNMGTVGGNLCQEPRCWYYRAPEDYFHCLRKGGERCNAVLGENRYHSLFGAARTGQPGCASSCPAHVAIPVYLDLLRKGESERAGRLLLERNPMPAITGRVCPHTCEQSCNRSWLDEAVSTRGIERFLGDRILDQADAFYAPPSRSTRKRVAVVGAGPAGLAAAYYLRRAGHQVTVLDDQPEAGGMLRYCIPAYRLPGEVLRRQIQAYEGMGIHFVQNAPVGRGKAGLAALRRDFDAVFLATGSWREKRLGLEEEGLLTPGLPFLVAIRRGQTPPVGRKVLVIGGGSVAVDVAISAKRLGAGSVAMACLEARDEMPAFPEDLELALEEGIELLPSWGPKRVVPRDGKVAGMELVRCTSVFDAERRFRPTFDPAATVTFEADQLLVAIGQGPDVSYAGASIRSERGLLQADPETQATPLAGVWAGGDAVIGAGTVVQAVATGRRAARAIDHALRGRRGELPAEAPSCAEAPIELNAAALRRSTRARQNVLAPLARAIDREDSATLDLRAAETEAARCVNCGCVAVHASDLGPALVALGARITTTRRTIAAEDFFAARLSRATVLEADELVVEVRVPPPSAGSVQRYQKFRVRNAIDFPIVGVASVIRAVGGRIQDVRLVFGAVAPVPLRAREVEEYLVGRIVSDETAAAAAAIAVRGVVPLSENRFKVQILRTLVERAVLGTT